jgi:hypothetical protein
VRCNAASARTRASRCVPMGAQLARPAAPPPRLLGAPTLPVLLAARLRRLVPAAAARRWGAGCGSKSWENSLRTPRGGGPAGAGRQGGGLAPQAGAPRPAAAVAARPPRGASTRPPAPHPVAAPSPPPSAARLVLLSVLAGPRQRRLGHVRHQPAAPRGEGAGWGVGVGAGKGRRAAGRGDTSEQRLGGSSRRPGWVARRRGGGRAPRAGPRSSLGMAISANVRLGCRGGGGGVISVGGGRAD